MLKVKGLTLTELIVAISITGISLGIAAPNFSNIINDNRMTTHYNELLAALALTRSEAIKRQMRVTTCQSSTGYSCTKDSSNWQKGWVVFTDRDVDNQIDNDETILHVHQALPEGIHLSFGARTRVAYHATGYAVGGSNGTFLFCDHRGDNSKKGLVISMSGRPRKADKADLNSCP